MAAVPRFMAAVSLSTLVALPLHAGSAPIYGESASISAGTASVYGRSAAMHSSDAGSTFSALSAAEHGWC
eukprot:1164712-Rhodomonas_salina.1